jgi:hypothetical protein
LRFSKTSEALDSTLARFAWLVPKIRFDTIPNLGSDACAWNASEVLNGFRSEDDVEAQSG